MKPGESVVVLAGPYRGRRGTTIGRAWYAAPVTLYAVEVEGYGNHDFYLSEIRRANWLDKLRRRA